MSTIDNLTAGLAVTRQELVKQRTELEMEAIPIRTATLLENLPPAIQNTWFGEAIAGAASGVDV
jgi:hypothetical protein